MTRTEQAIIAEARAELATWHHATKPDPQATYFSFAVSWHRLAAALRGER